MKFSYNSGLVQILLVGCLAFCCPGMFNALNGLGGAGTDDTDISAAANSALYGAFFIFGYLGGAAFNIFGNKILMCAGGMTYVVYAICSYFAGEHSNIKWLAIVGGAILGCGAGWFWTAQGAMMMAYPLADERGKFFSYFWIIFNLGGTVGGILMFGINYDSTGGSAGKANPASYFTLVGIMAVGALGALLLANPKSVRRTDGSGIHFEKKPSAWEEIKGALRVATNRYMLILAIPFFASNWFYTYQFNSYNGVPFNIRTRGLNTALYWAAQMFGAYCFGLVMDRKSLSVGKRAWYGYTICFFVYNISQVLGAIIQYSWKGGFEKDAAPDPLWDIKESSTYAFPCIVYLLFGCSDAVIQIYAYWLMAAIAGENETLMVLFSGFYKGVQSAGACIAWAIDLKVNSKPQFWIQWALLLLAMILMACAAYLVPTAMEENSRAAKIKENERQEAASAMAQPEEEAI